MTRMRRGDREADPGEEDDRTGRERGLRVLDALTAASSREGDGAEAALTAPMVGPPPVTRLSGL